MKSSSEDTYCLDLNTNGLFFFFGLKSVHKSKNPGKLEENKSHRILCTRRTNQFGNPWCFRISLFPVIVERLDLYLND